MLLCSLSCFHRYCHLLWGYTVHSVVFDTQVTTSGKAPPKGRAEGRTLNGSKAAGSNINPVMAAQSEVVIEGSLEVKLPTIWTDEKQSREEAERRERLEERRVEEKD